MSDVEISLTTSWGRLIDDDQDWHTDGQRGPLLICSHAAATRGEMEHVR